MFLHAYTAVLRRRRGRIPRAVFCTLALILLGTACAGCGNSSSGAASGKLTVRLALLAEGYDVPTFYAAEKGYFKQQGLNVDIRESTGSSTTTKLVGNGQADIGFADLATVAKGVNEGVPVKAVGAVFQKTPLATIYLPGHGINSPHDLAGKTVGDEPGSATAQYFPGFLASAHIPASSVKSVNVDAGAREQLLMSGKIDAFNSYGVEDVPILETKYKRPAADFSWGDYGLNMLGLGIIASNDTIQSHPDIVRKFLAAYAKGYVEAAKNPRAGAQAVLNHFHNAAGGSLPTLIKQWKLAQGLQQTDSTQGKPLLWMSPTSWTQTLQTNAKFGDSKTSKPASDFYTNKFVAKVAKPAAP